MTGFRFRLDKVLEWRRKEFQIEKNRLGANRASLNLINENIGKLQATSLSIGREFASRSSIPASELCALGPYHLGVKKQELQWNGDRVVRESAVQAQTVLVQTAQRRVRLLEKLRERRMSEFAYAETRDLENLASEAYLCKRSVSSAAKKPSEDGTEPNVSGHRQV